MTTYLFDHLDVRLSMVQRWTVVPTINKQTVADHMHQTAVIAQRIALTYYPDNYAPFHNLYYVVNLALHHDRHEGVTGDVPAPVSRLFDKGALESHFDHLMREEEMRPYTEEVGLIVKMADIASALLFMAVEQSMGNVAVRFIAQELMERLRNVAPKEVFDDIYKSYINIRDNSHPTLV